MSMRPCKDIEYDVLGLAEIPGWSSDPCATYTMRQTNARFNTWLVPGLNVQAAVQLTIDRLEWKKLRPSKRC